MRTDKTYFVIFNKENHKYYVSYWTREWGNLNAANKWDDVNNVFKYIEYYREELKRFINKDNLADLDVRQIDELKIIEEKSILFPE